MDENAQPLPARIPANGTPFPAETLEHLAASRLKTRRKSNGTTVELADGRTGSYYLEPGLNGGGTWILRR